jgi:HAE1 family hydrophobic/amphiphilic exporter-1
VGQVSVGGSVQRQVQIKLHPTQMLAYQIGIDEVLAAIRTMNQDMPAGSLRADTQEQLVRIEGKLKVSSRLPRSSWCAARATRCCWSRWPA